MEDNTNLHPSLQAGLQNLILKSTQTREKCRDIIQMQNLDKAFEKVIDLLETQDTQEEAAHAILEALDIADALLENKESPTKKIQTRIQKIFKKKTEEDRNLAKAKKILKSQGPDGIRILLGKLRWESSRTESPMESALLTRTAEKIKKLIPSNA